MWGKAVSLFLPCPMSQHHDCLNFEHVVQVLADPWQAAPGSPAHSRGASALSWGGQSSVASAPEGMAPMFDRPKQHLRGWVHHGVNTDCGLTPLTLQRRILCHLQGLHVVHAPRCLWGRQLPILPVAGFTVLPGVQVHGQAEGVRPVGEEKGYRYHEDSEVSGHACA